MADITPGYTFENGERNVDHIKLNTATAGTINTTFHTGKSSVGANPSTSANELMVYDSSAQVFKKGSLATIVFDHTSFLSARTAKTVPVAADLLLVADSAASNALKQMTAANLLFGAAAHAAPIAADKIPIYNSSGTAIGTITLANLINLAVAHTAPVTADEMIVRENGGAFRKMTLGDLINGATALTVPAAGQFVTIYDGAYKKVDLAVLISGIATALTSPAGTELLQLNDAGTLKKITFANLKTYCQGGTLPYVLVVERTTSGTDGAAFTSGAWQTRALTTEVVDTDNLASVAASTVTLAAGTYRFRAEAVARDCGQHRLRLYDQTAGVAILTGLCARSANNNSTVSVVAGRFTIAVPKDIRLQHYCTTNGTFGTAVSDGDVEVYSQLELWKEA